MFCIDRQLRSQWYDSPSGRVALQQLQALLRYNICSWRRRQKKLLVLYGANDVFTEALWEAGFDLTVHSEDVRSLYALQKNFGDKIDTCVASADSLPFEDYHFDYAIVLAGQKLVSAADTVGHELSRLVSSGCIFIFPNKYSFFAKEMYSVAPSASFISPHAISHISTTGFSVRKRSWSSVLLTSSKFWLRPGWSWVNSGIFSLPIGAFAAMRLDLQPMCQGTPLVLHRAVASSGE